MKVLLIIEQCNPEWPSVPLVGYRFFQGIDQLVDVTLVTHIRNKPAIEARGHRNVIFMPESALVRNYYRLVGNVSSKIWSLYHTLTYPIYAEFNHNVDRTLRRQVLAGNYDLVHVITPMMPRYPVELIKACRHTPFLLGPVNGGVPFPPGFQETARKEWAFLNFLKNMGRWLIPNYARTYQKADKILSGSTFTLKMLQQLFAIPDSKISLFYENGVDLAFLSHPVTRTNSDLVKLLFVGRLVPYKGADMVIEAIAQLEARIQHRLRLTIVGDGPERVHLEAQVQQLGLSQVVEFVGWVEQQETLTYYRQADIFCFPSIREFGGAVVLEAMACGLPCIVVNNGGIGEYVTDETGFKLEPASRATVMQGLTEKIALLVENEPLRQQLSKQAIDRAQEFEWQNKAKQMVEIYQQLVAAKQQFIQTVESP